MPSLTLNPSNDGYYDRTGNEFASPQANPSSYMIVSRAGGDDSNPESQIVTFFEFDITSDLSVVDSLTVAELTIKAAANSDPSPTTFGVGAALNRTTYPTDQTQAEAIQWSIPETNSYLNGDTVSGTSYTLDVTEAVKAAVGSPTYSGGKILLGLIPTRRSTNDGYQTNRHQIHGEYSGQFSSGRPQLSLTWTDSGVALPSTGSNSSTGSSEAGGIVGSTVNTTIAYGSWNGDDDDAPVTKKAFTRFTGLSIGQGESILSARLLVSSNYSAINADNSVYMRGNVYFEDVDNSPTTSGSTASQLNARTRTTAFTNSDIRNDESTQNSGYAPDVHPQDKISVDVTAQLQEVIDRAGWSSGNAVTVFFDNDGWTGIDQVPPTGNFSATSTNATYSQEPPVLQVAYVSSAPATEADPQDAQSSSEASNVSVNISGVTSKSFQASPTGEGYYDRFGNEFTSPQNSANTYLPVGQANGDGTNPSCRVISYFEFNINSEIDPSDTITQAFIRLGVGSNSEAGAPRFGVAGCLNRTTVPTSQEQAEAMIWSIPTTAEISHDSYTSGNTVDLGCEEAIKAVISGPDWSGGKILLGLIPLDYSTNDQLTGNRHQFESLYSSAFGGQRAQLNLNWDDYGKGLPSTGADISATPGERGIIDHSGNTSPFSSLSFGGSSTNTESSYFRWDGLGLSQGSTITSARLVLSNEFTSRTAENKFMQGASFEVEDSDDSASTSGSTGTQILARTRIGSVAASVYNDESVSTAADQPIVHPNDKFVVDVTELVQSIVNRAGWVQGSAIMIVADGIDFGGTISNQGSIAKYGGSVDWDQDPPLLEITSNSVLGTLTEPQSIQSSSEVSETNVVKSALPITVDSVEVAAHSEQIDVVPNATAQNLEVVTEAESFSILASKTPTRTIHIW